MKCNEDGICDCKECEEFRASYGVRGGADLFYHLIFLSLIALVLGLIATYILL